MTRRERMKRRLERRKEWAGKARAESTGRFEAAQKLAEQIPLGQPILVGHHSERRARRDADRITSNMTKGCEAAQRAEQHAAKAAGLTDALDSSIFSDDADAVEALESRIAAREAQAARIRALNVAIRRELKAGLPAGWMDRIGATEEERRQMLRNVEFGHDRTPMYPGYTLANLRGRIKADRERLAMVKARQARTCTAQESAAGVTVERLEHGYCRVTFAEKPERAVLEALRAAGFWWRNGSWAGKLEALPAGIATDLVRPEDGR